MSDDDNNVVLLPGIGDGVDRHELIPEVKRRKYGDCRHRGGTTIDEQLHRLVCNQCNEEVDPIEWIERISREWESVAGRLTKARKDAEAAEQRLESFLRRLKNARGRQRRLPAQQQLEVVLLGCIGRDGEVDRTRLYEAMKEIPALVIALSAQAQQERTR